MAEPPRLLIAGGAGVFGRLLVRELLQATPAQILIAGRDLHAATEACQDLDAAGRVRPLAIDLGVPGELVPAAAGCFAVICAAGPFQGLPRDLTEAAVRAGAHWLDIADASDWVLPLLADRVLSAQAEAAGLAVMPGLSTVPALSGMLVRWCCARLSDARSARITLFIGNRNAKGTGAIASALEAGFADPREVRLPTGRRVAYRFASPDTALLRQELGLTAEFRVAFELRLTNRLMAALSPLSGRMAPDQRRRLARLLSLLAAPVNGFGSDAGCLQAEVRADNGRIVRAALIGHGQRLVILPCALALEALLSGELQRRGTVHPATWLEPETWIERLSSRGVRFVATPVGSA